MIRPCVWSPTTVSPTLYGAMPGPNLASSRKLSSIMIRHCVCSLFVGAPI